MLLFLLACSTTTSDVESSEEAEEASIPAAQALPEPKRCETEHNESGVNPCLPGWFFWINPITQALRPREEYYP